MRARRTSSAAWCAAAERTSSGLSQIVARAKVKTKTSPIHRILRAMLSGYMCDFSASNLSPHCIHIAARPGCHSRATIRLSIAARDGIGITRDTPMLDPQPAPPLSFLGSCCLRARAYDPRTRWSTNTALPSLRCHYRV
ncbi:hypothetical protein BD310DRAFT_110772 [Dichomitus squalens]|uniref:Uncharacterized protein n=1 Tax=Dichomitus squalens TaxID=114155 RepID=A0A4Q9PIV4_9APHY|nr:hypothetical protein BD310DRAFT_110772 [Dichomitus squalens]